MARGTYYPGANRSAQWFGDKYPGTRFDRIEKVVLHSTEGSSWDPYAGGANAPTLTARPNFDTRRLEWRQHFWINQSARALRHPAGYVDTNNDHVIQMELVGTCDRASRWSARHVEMWDPPEWVVLDIALFLRWVHAEWGVPLTAPDAWPRCSGAVAQPRGVRLSQVEWNAYRGVLGHMHVPGNTHRDPGDLPIRRILGLAKGSTGVSKQDVVDGLGVNVARNRNGKTPTVKTVSVADWIEMGDQKLDDLLALSRAQKKSLDAMSAALVALTSNSPIAIKEAFSIGLKALHDELTSIEARIVLE